MGEETLAGSCCSMLDTLHSLVHTLAVPVGEAVAMLSENPARSVASSSKITLVIANFLQFQQFSRIPMLRLQCCSLFQVFFKSFSCLEKNYNTVVTTSAIREPLLNFGLELKKLRNELAIKELLLNFGLELKKLRDEFY